jgi:hypothetical protein
MDRAGRFGAPSRPHSTMESAMMKIAWVVVAVPLALAGCGKVQEKATEKMIESSISKDGTQAKVDLSQGGIKVATTDASGKTTQMEMGNAKITEADLGLPFYPGASPKEGASMRIAQGSNVSLQQVLHSNDAPDKVAAFYRDKLKAMAEGKQLMDMSSGDGASISLIDDKAKSSMQVHVSKADDKGSDIMIAVTREGTK